VTGEFHGRGPSFPLQVGAGGGIRESAGGTLIDESLRAILGTQYGERVMRPDFGCNLRSLVFAPNDEATANLARHLVETGLSRWEPRIELVRVDVRTDGAAGALVISVEYRVRATQEARSLVYPFYLEAV
jgi:phage baseplate assembly protein W